MIYERIYGFQSAFGKNIKITHANAVLTLVFCTHWKSEQIKWFNIEKIEKILGHSKYSTYFQNRLKYLNKNTNCNTDCKDISV